MKDERLYIDGELVDINAETKIALNFKSNLFRNVSDMAQNSTLSIRLPKTSRNQRILWHSDLVQSAGIATYANHNVSYYRNGVELIRDGIITILRVSNTAFEMSIHWGLSRRLERMSKKGVSLRDLSSSHTILFQKENEISTKSQFESIGYGYARYTPWRDQAVSISERTAAQNMVFPKEEKTTPRTEYFFGGRRGDSGQKRRAYIHPVVRVSWLLERIKQEYGIEFDFLGDAREFIDTLAIPLVSKKSNALTFQQKYHVGLGPREEDGFLRINAIGGNNLFRQEENGLLALSSTDIIFDVSGGWEFSLQGMSPVGTSGHSIHGGSFSNTDGTASRGWRGDRFVLHNTYKLSLIIKGRKETREFTIGADTDSGWAIDVEHGYRDTLRFDYTGKGKISVEEGDIVLFLWKRIAINKLRDAKFIGGTVTMTAAESDSVPFNTPYPIDINLPNIKIFDLIKTLAVLTGTFPVKRESNSHYILFKPFATILSNRNHALDWTNRVIAQGNENKPKEITFHIDSYAQNSYYRWKSDDTVKNNYNGVIRIPNETLELESTIFELPFAATDGDNIPLYVQGDGTTEENAKPPQYKACKDRIMQYKTDDDGCIRLYFNMALQNIIDAKHTVIRDALKEAKIITEKMRVRDVDLANFDETRPVYLAQYSAYFAVLEIRTDDNGLADVTMLKLNF